ncbi:MAG: M6 family metalloprotease domain-containing protein [Oscillospiraceae bacterium]|nr:M6 family metalloprotease domain-containing protein [Oscillospiraceae bacterium]
MNRIRKAALLIISIAALAALFAAAGMAAPALSVERTFTQPGGGQFLGTPCGDEFFHYVKASDGAVLTRGEDGVWYHAGTDDRYLLDAPAARANEAQWTAQQAAAHPAPDYSELLPDISPGGGLTAQAVTGNQTLLVLLVDFLDVQIQYEERWADLVFGEENSVKRYYSEATGGSIHVVPARESYTGAGAANDGVARVSLNYNHPNNSSRESTIAIDAIKAAAGCVDYAAYDINKDRRITGSELQILVVCAGYEDSGIGETPSVWAHYYMSPFGIGSEGGKTIVNYMMVGEIYCSQMMTIGIPCHELGHGFGLPDLYSNGDSAGLGGFSLMASGCYGATSGQYSGETPVFLDAYCLELLGAFPVQALPTGASFAGAVQSMSTGDKNILRLNVPGGKEYFLIENRQFEMYDAGLWKYNTVSGGMAVYRVNTEFKNNYVDGRQLVTLLEADEGVLGYSMLQQKGRLYGNDPFYYLSEDEARPICLSRATVPSTLLQNGGSGWFSLLCMSEPDPAMELSISPILTASPQVLALNYRGAGKITPTYAAAPVTYTSSNPGVVTVDSNGSVSSVGTGTAAITVSDATGMTDTVAVTVSYAWWQWLVRVLLLGFLWY